MILNLDWKVDKVVNKSKTMCNNQIYSDGKLGNIKSCNITRFKKGVKHAKDCFTLPKIFQHFDTTL